MKKNRKKKWKGFLKNGPALFSVLLAAGGCGDRGGPSLQKPNFVIILVDDLAWNDVGCYGEDYAETPNIDQLAEAGMKFERAYASCAVCSPTRAALLTGKYPARLHITDYLRFDSIPTDIEYLVHRRNDSIPLVPPVLPDEMPREEVTLAEMLKTEGYVTCHLGKWHLGGEGFEPQDQGFDINVGGGHTGLTFNYFDPYYKEGLEEYRVPNIEPREKGEYLTDRLTGEAVQFIRNNRDRPFFLHLSHYAVHTPIQAKDSLVRRYLYGRHDDVHKARYAAMKHSVDLAAGRVIQVLEEEGVMNNTLIIFTSDNGGLQGVADNSPLRGGKRNYYEGGIRVPFIARWDGKIEPGSVSGQKIASMDIFPTICGIAGIETDSLVVDGTDISPVLFKQGKLTRDTLFWHFPHYGGSRPRIKPNSTVMAGDWKLIRYYEDEHFELFNLAEDMAEQNDLTESMPEKVEEMDRVLADWLQSVGALLPEENPHYKVE